VDGHRCVAGTSTDPTDGRVDCLVEYAPQAVLGDREPLARLIHRVMAAEPRHAWRDLVVRTPATVVPPAPLTRDLTYLVLGPGAGVPGPQLPPGLRIGPASGPDDDARVRAWLRRAVVAGNGQRAIAPDDAAIEETVELCVSAPDRLSLLVRADGPAGPEPVAHATLLTGARDELHGTPFIDLVDILVADGHDTRLLTAALVAACARHATAAGLPLVGNVVHGRQPDGTDPGTRVVDSLAARGWQPRDTYWRCALEPDLWEPR
ncbi:hypothetical protein AB0K09_32355, partial [Streptomyces sp. NPDC049577]|uniref:hypothetical protein n=1 Tax=Streptomyces sp. NPDC049577 TaxID=3155153 RepID=UPI003440E0EA